MELQTAFKEWAVICRALEQGKQALILRKGGIAESGGQFTLEHDRFWLLPTYTHQQESGIREEAAELLDAVQADKPPPGELRLSHWAHVTGIYRVRDLPASLLLAHLHFWSDETVRQRFAYRQPGINVFTVRVYKAEQVHTLPNLPEYEGCKSWVHLQTPLCIDRSVPVLTDEEYQDVKRQLDKILQPTGFA